MGKIRPIKKYSYYQKTSHGGFIATKLNYVIGWGRK